MLWPNETVVEFDRSIYWLRWRSLRKALGDDADRPKYIESLPRPAARESYEEFLPLWRDADPDLPAHKNAEAEYAALVKTHSN